MILLARKGRVRAVACAICTLLAAAACDGSQATDGDDAEPESSTAGRSGAPESAEPTCPDPNEIIDPTELIDDMEDENGLIAPVDGRSGGWWTAGDDTPAATLHPAPSDTAPAPPERISAGRCGSRYAMRMTGQGFEDWGSILGMSFAYAASGALPYDASRHQGITFWARVGDTSTNQVRVAFSDRNNEPAAGLCVENGPAEVGCFDSFGIFLTKLDVKWKHFRVPFAGLEQRNFGLKSEGVATEGLYGVHFAFDANAIFDLWIDDISFY